MKSAKLSHITAVKPPEFCIKNVLQSSYGHVSDVILGFEYNSDQKLKTPEVTVPCISQEVLDIRLVPTSNMFQNKKMVL